MEWHQEHTQKSSVLQETKEEGEMNGNEYLCSAEEET